MSPMDGWFTVAESPEYGKVHPSLLAKYLQVCVSVFGRATHLWQLVSSWWNSPWRIHPPFYNRTLREVTTFDFLDFYWIRGSDYISPKVVYSDLSCLNMEIITVCYRVVSNRILIIVNGTS